MGAPEKWEKLSNFDPFNNIISGGNIFSQGQTPLPIGSMGLESLSILYIWLRVLDVDKFIPYMDPLGIECH